MEILANKHAMMVFKAMGSAPEDLAFRWKWFASTDIPKRKILLDDHVDGVWNGHGWGLKR